MVSKGAHRPVRRLKDDERGISSVEFAIVCSLFFLIVLGIIDFSRAMWEWNAAAKATQFGVRYAVVNNMVSIPLRTFDGTAIVSAGETIEVGSMGAALELVICTSTGCNNKPADLDSVRFTAIVDQMKQRYSRIQPENVIVEYRNIGLGFAGNPLGPDIDPLVTVRLTGLTFIFITPGLSGIFSITMPDFAASLTGEDHNTI